jgi:two-component system NtrC family sensor kinase
VLVALLVNAIEAMEDGGDASPGRYANREHHRALVMADTGVGIPEDAIGHIFEPFFSTKDKESGVGLGLAVVYGIVQGHHGTIDVTSQPGKGTTFTVRLPRSPKPPKSPNKESA